MNRDISPRNLGALAVVGLFCVFLFALYLIVSAPDGSPTELIRIRSAGAPGSTLEANWQPAYDEWALTQFAAAVQRQEAQIVSDSPVAVREPVVYEGPGSPWDGIAQCETGGDWSMQGSKYSGGLGFYNGTWDSYGGQEFAPNAGMATREQQIIVAERVLADVGITAWGCHSYYG